MALLKDKPGRTGPRPNGRLPARRGPTSNGRAPQPPAGEGKPHPGRRLTEDEFAAWVDDKTRAEWVDGEVVLMAAVSVDHDDAAFWVRGVAADFVEHHDLGTVHGEVSVRLPNVRQRRTPDVAVVLRPRAHIVRSNLIDGPPDLIAEVVSPDSVPRDWQQKYLEYAKGGVKEYWVIDRLAGQMEAYTLRPGGKYARIAEADGKLASAVLPGFYLRPEWVLGNWTVSRRAAAKELGV